MKPEVKEVIDWFCPVITEEGAKKLLGNFYKAAKKEVSEETLDILAKNYVSWMCQGNIKDEEKQDW